MKKTAVAMLTALLCISIAYGSNEWQEKFTPEALELYTQGKDATYILQLAERPARAHKDIIHLSGCDVTYYSSSSSFAIAVCKPQNIRALAQRPKVLRIFEDEVHTPFLYDDGPEILAPNATAEYGVNGTGVLIAVVDSGMNTSHPFLQGRIEAEMDFTFDGHTQDLTNHGTPVAGIIASVNDTWRGIAPGAKLLNAKACTQIDAQAGCPNSWVMPAVDWAIEQGADVIQLGMGGYVTPCSNSQLALYINETAEANSTPIVAGAGNGGPINESIYSPACGINTIAVGASKADGTLEDFSSRGPVEGASGMKPDLVAPGSTSSAHTNGQLTGLTGTSASGPFVSGVIALMLEANGNLSWQTVKELLKNSSDDLGLSVDEQGAGQVNALQAVNLSLAFTPAPPAPDPFVNWTTTLNWPQPAPKNQNFNVNYTALNIGNVNATNTEVEISGHSGWLTLQSGPALQTFGDVDVTEQIAPGWVFKSKKTGSWLMTINLRSDQKNVTEQFTIQVQ